MEASIGFFQVGFMHSLGSPKQLTVNVLDHER